MGILSLTSPCQHFYINKYHTLKPIVAHWFRNICDNACIRIRWDTYCKEYGSIYGGFKNKLMSAVGGSCHIPWQNNILYPPSFLVYLFSNPSVFSQLTELHTQPCKPWLSSNLLLSLHYSQLYSASYLFTSCWEFLQGHWSDQGVLSQMYSLQLKGVQIYRDSSSEHSGQPIMCPFDTLTNETGK